jgi:GMP synthase (glutamine-hydrolysing)
MTTEPNWLAIQHVDFEGPGLIAELAAQRGLALEVCHVYRGEQLPAQEEIAGLVVMGGPMGVADTVEHPQLLLERELIASLARSGRPVLGVCLGAQLLADALGARVYRGAADEVGLGAVSLTAAGREDPVLGAPGLATLPVMHWHRDTFDLPAQASWLARSDRYPHQAFRMGERAYGLQFHVEVNRELADAWADHLPSGVSLAESDRVEVERTGRTVLEAFFALA